MGNSWEKELRELLKECTAHVRGATGGSGSGFFIDENLLLTCAHVVKGKEGDTVTVQPYKRESRDGKIIRIRQLGQGDMALICVECDPGESPQPAVALSFKVKDGTRFFSVGYPKDDIDHKVGLEERTYAGNARRDNSGDLVERLRLSAGGERIVEGQSGSAIFNADTGAVVAMMQYTSDPADNLGGGGIPIDRVRREFEEVQHCVDKPPLATRRWRDILGRDGWEKLENKWEWKRTFEVAVHGTPSAWRITLETFKEQPCEITGQKLPCSVSEAVFAWAQSRRLRSDEDLALIGRLLGAALLPDPVLSRLRGEAQSDHLLIRLKFDDDSRLADVPWEFATTKTEDEEKAIGTDSRFSLVRVAERKGQVRTEPAIRARALSIIIHPDNWKGMMPRKTGVHWPDADGLGKRLGNALQPCRRIELENMPNPQPSDIRKSLNNKDKPDIDIVHYRGFGSFDHDSAEVAFSDGNGGVEMRSIEYLFRIAKESGARMLVIQFFLPPANHEFEPIPARVFQKALKGNINAVVYTCYHMHPQQTNAFNKSFYDYLGEGRPVEQAVQSARADLELNAPLADKAAFGWFNLLTGPTPNMRFGRADDASAPAAMTRDQSRQPVDGTRRTGGERPSRPIHQDEFTS